MPCRHVFSIFVVGFALAGCSSSEERAPVSGPAAPTEPGPTGESPAPPPAQRPPSPSASNDAGSEAPAKPDICTSVTGPETVLSITNERDERLTLWWLAPDDALVCKEVDYGSLEPKAERTQRTYVDHAWAIRSSTGALVRTFFVKAESKVTVQ